MKAFPISLVLALAAPFKLASCAAYIPEANAEKISHKSDRAVLEYWRTRNNVCRGSLDNRHLRMHQENARAEALRRRLVRNSAVSAIEAGHAMIGMTENEARAAWGYPSDINTTTTSYGSSQQWVYLDHGSYLYFEAGTVRTIQN